MALRLKNLGTSVVEIPSLGVTILSGATATVTGGFSESEVTAAIAGLSNVKLMGGDLMSVYDYDADLSGGIDTVDLDPSFIITDGNTLTVQSGGAISIETGGLLNAVTPVELATIHSATAGTVVASKAVVVDSNKDALGFRNISATNVDAGASGTAGTVDVYPTTSSKGKLQIACTDQVGNTTVAVNVNAMAQATTLNIVDPGNSVGYISVGQKAKMLAYSAFDVAAATLNADDGTGIKIASVTIAANAIVTAAYVDVSQGCGDAGDTLELVINNTDDLATPVKTLVAAQDVAAASKLVYTPVSSTSVTVAKTTATNCYVVVGYKDVGNDASATTALQGNLIVEYVLL